MKMMDPKENKKIIDDYDYLSNAASSQDYTGLIPFLPVSEAELESYNDVYRIYPPVLCGKDEDNKKRPR